VKRAVTVPLLLVAAVAIILLLHRPPPPPQSPVAFDGDGGGIQPTQLAREPVVRTVREGATGAVANGLEPAMVPGRVAATDRLAPTPEIAAVWAVSNAALPAVSDNLTPETVLEQMRLTIRHYAGMYAGNPVGNNAEITHALNGDNPKQVKFIGAESGLRINAQGELVDPWGTPFFFHQLSATEMEIRSAGPDKEMWTWDDLVTK
jgi:hypothetical protein